MATPAWVDEAEARLIAKYDDLLAPILAEALTAHVNGLTADLTAFDGLGGKWTMGVQDMIEQDFTEVYLTASLEVAASSPVGGGFDPLKLLDDDGKLIEDPVQNILAQQGGANAFWNDFTQVVNRNAQQYIKTATNRIVGATQQLWADVQDRVINNIARGMDINTLRREVEDISGFATSRAQAIARTETLNAYNGGDWDGAKALGKFGPTHKSWLATFDARTRPSHAEANGQTVPMEEPFKVGGVEMMRPHAPGAPAAEVVNCRCVTQMFWPGDTLPDGSEAPAVVEPDWVPPDIEVAGELTPTPSNLGGVHPKQVYRDANGDEYLFKPMDDWLAHGEAMASEVALRAGLNVPRVSVRTINGQTGSFQKLLPNARAGFGKNGQYGFDPTKVDAADLLTMQQHRMLDWMIGNHDGHGGQWIRQGYATQGARVIGVDKGQAFKYFGRGEKLDYKWKPPDRLGDPDTVYAAMEKAFAEGRLGLKQFARYGNKNQVTDTVDALMRIPDVEYRAMLRPYANGRWGVGSRQADDFIESMVVRKNALADDMGKYHRKLARQNKKARDKLNPPPPKNLPLGVRGGPKGMNGATPSRADLDFGAEYDHPIMSRDDVSDSLIDYTGGSYTRINRGLRDGTTPRGVNAIRKDMRPIKKDMVVYRGTTLRGEGLPPGGVEALQGSVFRDKGFMSTFLDSSQTVPGIAKGNLGFQIRVNEGTRGAWVTQISNHRSEREFVLADDSHLYVHKVRKSTKVGWEQHFEHIMEVEVVDPQWARERGVQSWIPHRGFSPSGD